MAGSPAPQLFRNQLKGSSIIRFPAALNPLFEGVDFKLSCLDKGGDIERAILEGFGSRLCAESAGISPASLMIHLLLLIDSRIRVGRAAWGVLSFSRSRMRH